VSADQLADVARVRRRVRATGSTLPMPAAQSKTDVADVIAFAPQKVTRGESFLVQVFVGKTGEDEAAAKTVALASDPSASKRAIATLDVELAYGDRIDFKLEAAGLSIEEAEQSLIWRREPRSCAFIVTVPNDYAADHAAIKARVYRQAVPIGKIVFSMPIGAEVPSESLAPVGDISRVYRRAFLSYASSDRSEVIKRAQALRAARIDFFMDLLSIEPGERWEKSSIRKLTNATSSSCSGPAPPASRYGSARRFSILWTASRNAGRRIWPVPRSIR
jgi:hypothetical protein